MIESEVRRLTSAGESLNVEFKSNSRRPFSDREIYENVVCLANTDGGVLLLGVENDGQITGARPRHGEITDPNQLQAAIFNNTEPHVNTRVSVLQLSEGHLIAIEVDPYPEVCMTSAGVCLRRVMKTDGPSCQPFLPHEQLSRRITLGLHDLTSQQCPGATFDNLDPLQFERAVRSLSDSGVTEHSSNCPMKRWPRHWALSSLPRLNWSQTWRVCCSLAGRAS